MTSSMSEPECKVGDRIRLLQMDDDVCPIPVGTTGQVIGIAGPFRSFGLLDDGWFQIAVKWDIERSLSMCWPKDEFEVI